MLVFGGGLVIRQNIKVSVSVKEHHFDSERNHKNMTNEQAKKIGRAKHMMIAQQIKYFNDDLKTTDKIYTHITNVIIPKRFALILHDKDVIENNEPVEPHIHIMLSFENARSLNRIAELMGIETQYIQKWNGDSNLGYAYLIHATDNASDQYQYSVDEVIANFDYSGLIKQIELDVKKAKNRKSRSVINMVLDNMKNGLLTIKDAEAFLTGSQYAQAKPKLENVWRWLQMQKAEKWRKEMIENGRSIDVIYIFGKSGNGKTRLAKQFAEKNDKNFFLTGSSRDPFQLYEEQSTIILDELRPSIFPYSDLLKLLDPFNFQSNAPSRYFDKAITADRIIITSPYSPKEFYKRIIENDKYFDEEIDSYYQFARRLGLVIFLTRDHMEIEFFNEQQRDFVLDSSTKRINPYKEDTVNNILSQNEKAEKLFKEIIEAFSPDSNTDQENCKKTLNKQTALFETHTKLEVTKKVIKTKNEKSPIIKPTKANDDETQNKDN